MKKLFLSAAFVALGTFAMAQQTPTSGNRMNHGAMKHNMEMQQQKQLDKMKTELNLNDNQVMRIKALQQQRAEDRQNRMAANKVAMMNKRTNAKNEMKQILTPDQYSKWESHMKNKMNHKKGKKMMKRNHASKMQSK